MGRCTSFDETAQEIVDEFAMRLALSPYTAAMT